MSEGQTQAPTICGQVDAKNYQTPCYDDEVKDYLWRDLHEVFSSLKHVGFLVDTHRSSTV